MNTQQIIVFVLLAALLVLFVWNRWRYDVVAMVGLLIAAVTGVVPPAEVFSGFSHPAVITVTAVLVLSRSLLNAGVVDAIAVQLGRVGNRPTLQVAAMTGLVTVFSGFMNNVGALALLMPAAVWISRKSRRSPSLLLMPLAFGSLLGGLMTLIGTPPNLIISAYRAQESGSPFLMFDFFPVGASAAFVGVAFIALLGWRLIPKPSRQAEETELFEISDYLSEVRLPDKSKFIGLPLHDLISALPEAADAVVVGLIRGTKRYAAPSLYQILRAGDILLVETDSAGLKTLIDQVGLEFIKSQKDLKELLASEEIRAVEVVIAPESPLIGRTAIGLNLRQRYGINVIAVARRGKRLKERLGRIRFAPADILLLQGGVQSLPSALAELGCLPLAQRDLRIGKPRNIIVPLGIFAAAMAVVALHLLPAEVALTAAAVLMVLIGFLSPAEAYKSINWTIVVLLGAMIPIGHAFETTGGADLIAQQIQQIARIAWPPATLAILMIATMLLSNVINNAATAILMAPIGLGLAHGLNASADPFLMTVAIGASCAFLTPIGHQSSAMVMAPGGYRFADYWRMGLPLSAFVVATAIPMILWIWPL